MRSPTDSAKYRGLRWSYFAEAANSLFVGFTIFGPHFILFLDSLGISKAGIGVLLSLLPLMGLSALVSAPVIGRLGYKRTFLYFYGARKLVMASLLCTPLVLSGIGKFGGFLFVASVVAIFGLCRAIAETALLPWSMEYIPDEVRGRFSAVSGIFSTLIGLLAPIISGVVLHKFTGITPYMILIITGVFFGLVSVTFYSHIPGGEPLNAPHKIHGGYHNMAFAVRNRNFRYFLVGYGLMLTALSPTVVLLPLFYRTQIGLTLSQTVWTQAAMLAGSICTTYLWGKSSDRYGGKTVMQSGLLLFCLLPLGWMSLPRYSVASIYYVFAIEALRGIVVSAWGIGSAHYLYVSVIPKAKKELFTTVFYASSGLTSGISLILSGWVIDHTPNLSSTLLFLKIDLYAPLFIFMMVAPMICYLLFKQVVVNSASDNPQERIRGYGVL